MILFSKEKLGVVQSICFPSTLKTIKAAIDWTIDWTINWTIDWTVNNDQALTDQRNHQLALAWHLSLLKSTLPLLFSLFCSILSYLSRISFYPIGLMFLHMVDNLMVSTFVINLSCSMMSLSLLMFSQHRWYVDGVDLCNHPNLLDDAGAVLEVLTFLGKSSSRRND